jgi:hypothetical protein
MVMKLSAAVCQRRVELMVSSFRFPVSVTCRFVDRVLVVAA